MAKSAKPIAMAGTVTTLARLNVRKGAPGIQSPIALTLEPGASVAVTALVQGDNIGGTDNWYATADGYVWSGACANFHPADAGAVVAVHRRPNGTIETLKADEIRKVFGTFSFTEDKKTKGAIVIDPAWTAENIVALTTPLFQHIGHASIPCHKKASGPFERVFAALEKGGFADRILTMDGTFVPRHMGWDPARGLSSHSWGIAIDLNVRWNGYGVSPAQAGTHGSLRELVPCFEAEGFAWGGYFQPLKICDGMHFELARYDL